MITSTPDLSIIIVNWNVRELLAACLRSLQSQRSELRLQVIVVDSHSADDSVAMVRRDFPWVELIACEENVGFPKGNNLGLGQANGRYLLLLNPDTEVVGEALATMVAYAEAHPDVGALGPQLLNPDGSVQSSRRRFPTLATALFESSWLEPFAPASILGHYYVQDVADDETAVVDWVTGACLLVRREVVAQVGGLDEAYFMYSEELDWCYRIKAAGWQIIYLPTAQVIHHVGKSSEQAVTARHINFQRAKLRYFYKYHGWLTAWLLRLFILWNYGWQLFVEGLKGIVGHKRPLRWQRVRAYWQVLRSGLRPAGY
ncbi:MAG: glycosyltransferase family 2 protein [Chloroflexota bacterium]|jgi:N-acetylglucosaminyl-diphospho-decaprenol L-rhamnosyltransferase